jgi:hypothetical protein
MKNLLPFSFAFCLLFFSILAFSQSSPIQEGTSVYNFDLYHMNNVGLGITNPTATLHILAKNSGEINSNQDLLKIEGTVSNFPNPGFTTRPFFKVTSSGNVGVGVISPSEKMHIAGGIRLQTNDVYATISSFSSLDDYVAFRSNADYFRFDPEVIFKDQVMFEEQITLNNRLIIENSGNIDLALNSDGTIRAREVKVDLQVIPDYVFSSTYDLMTIQELKQFIEQNHHLPNIKSEAEFQKDGSYPLGEMNLKLLEKIEELTLYIIELEGRIDAIENDK